MRLMMLALVLAGMLGGCVATENPDFQGPTSPTGMGSSTSGNRGLSEENRAP